MRCFLEHVPYKQSSVIEALIQGRSKFHNLSNNMQSIHGISVQTVQ